MGIRKLRVMLRQKIYERRIRKTALKCGKKIKINGPSVVNRNTSLGNNVNFNGMMIIGSGSVIIGDNFHSGQGCYIITQNHDYDHGDSIPYDSTHSVEKPICIEDNVWFGVSVIILPGVTIGEGAIVGAGAVVTRDIPNCAIVAGNPARVIKYRDVEHYDSLKGKEKFF